MSYQAKRTLRRDGVDVEHYRFERGERTSRGQPIILADDSPETIKAIPDPGGKSVSYGTFGVEVEADMVYLVHEDRDIDGGGGEGASRIIQNDRTYVVIDVDGSQPHGYLVLECELDTEFDSTSFEENGGEE